MLAHIYPKRDELKNSAPAIYGTVYLTIRYPKHCNTLNTFMKHLETQLFVYTVPPFLRRLTDLSPSVYVGIKALYKFVYYYYYYYYYYFFNPRKTREGKN